ncbi:MAG: DUF4352 domain-containing protein, partial [Clostridiales bacterium]|nr:DUF4352 domain-containing protein [Clostridiales bacterium]
KQANLYPTKPMYRQPTYNSPTYTGRYSSTNNKSSVGTVITIITIVIIFITTLLSSYLGSKHERSIRLEDNENYSQIINDIIGGNSNYNHFEHFYEIYWQFDETFDLNEASITVNSVNMLELSDISDYLYYEDVIDTDLSYFGDWKFVSIPITVENNGEDDIYISDIILNLSCPVIPELYDNENIYSTDEDIVNIIPLNNLELTDIIPVGGSLTFDVIYALPKADIYTFYLQYGINLPYRFDFACFY